LRQGLDYKVSNTYTTEYSKICCVDIRVKRNKVVRPVPKIFINHIADTTPDGLYKMLSDLKN